MPYPDRAVINYFWFPFENGIRWRLSTAILGDVGYVASSRQESSALELRASQLRSAFRVSHDGRPTSAGTSVAGGRTAAVTHRVGRPRWRASPGSQGAGRGLGFHDAPTLEDAAAIVVATSFRTRNLISARQNLTHCDKTTAHP